MGQLASTCRQAWSARASSDSFTITDSFDTSILEYYASDAHDGSPYLWGHNTRMIGNVTFTTTPTSTGMTINVSSLPKTSSEATTATKLAI